MTSSQKDMNLSMSELTDRPSVFDEVAGRRYKHIGVAEVCSTKSITKHLKVEKRQLIVSNSFFN